MSAFIIAKQEIALPAAITIHKVSILKAFDIAAGINFGGNKLILRITLSKHYFRSILNLSQFLF